MKHINLLGTLKGFVTQFTCRIFIIKIISAVTFAALVIFTMSLKQDSNLYWNIESDGAFSIVLSNLYHSANFGEMNNIIHSYFIQAVNEKIPTSNVFEFIKVNLNYVEEESVINKNGDGIGYTLITYISFLCFGNKLESLQYFYLYLIFISSFLFINRFNDIKLFAVPFSILSFILAYSVLDVNIHNQIPIGGIRSYTFIAILPSLYILLDLKSNQELKRNWEYSLALFIQGIILSLSILVRGSTIYHLIIIFSLIILILLNINYNKRKIFLKISPLICSLVIILFIIPNSFFKSSVDSGRGNSNTWHRIFISLGAHPEWPFLEIIDKFEPCTLQVINRGGAFDGDAQCVWESYGNKNGLTITQLNNDSHGAVYQKIIKNTFFETIELVPLKVIETFFYYKPINAFKSFTQYFRIHKEVYVYLILYILTFLYFIFISIITIKSQYIFHENLLNGAIFIFGFSLFPVFLAWGVPYTMLDSFVLFNLLLITIILNLIIKNQKLFLWLIQGRSDVRLND